ncbi:hypothetical protein SAMN05443287_11943 [Micromonospora phaseoli]|uniref:ORC1/DEAH AAA+ ATPase domain-containing protein n=2 Tax=Micromonospora phaseoli TaxID=1144548 RepID=A0A1H7DVM9_9ACTN|nr:hypothetical protein CLV64_11442 [Micromonospora phaseoli]SEK05829.1 hypothetical protein SAMN05443287_11943 [Micromonospora phaseoli]
MSIQGHESERPSSSIEGSEEQSSRSAITQSARGVPPPMGGVRAVSADTIGGIVITGDYATVAPSSTGGDNSVSIRASLEGAGWRIPYEVGNVPYVAANVTPANVYHRLDSGNVCWISGPSGVGKSRLTVEFARQNAETYSFILWIDGTDENSFRLSLAQALEGRAAGRGSVIEELAARLTRTPARGLVVVDNMTAVTSDLLNVISANLGIHHLLVNTQAWSPGCLRLRPLGGDPDVLGWLSEVMDLTVDDAKMVIRFTGGLPIALLAVGQLVGDGMIDLEDYIEAEPLAIFADSNEYQASRAVAAVNVNLQRLLASREKARETLGVLAVCAAAPLPLDLLQSATGGRLPIKQAEQIASWTGGVFDRSSSTISTHSFIQETVRRLLRPEEVEHARSGLIRAIKESKSSDVGKVLPHAIALADSDALAAVARKAASLQMGQLARWLSSTALRMRLEQGSVDLWEGYISKLEHAKILLYVGHLSDARHVASETMRQLQMDGPALEPGREAHLRSGLLYVLGRAHPSSQLEARQQVLREAMFALHGACHWHLKVHAKSCKVTELYADEFSEMVRAVLVQTCYDYYGPLEVAAARGKHFLDPVKVVAEIRELLADPSFSQLARHADVVDRHLRNFGRICSQIDGHLRVQGSINELPLADMLRPLTLSKSGSGGGLAAGKDEATAAAEAASVLGAEMLADLSAPLNAPDSGATHLATLVEAVQRHLLEHSLKDPNFILPSRLNSFIIKASHSIFASIDPSEDEIALAIAVLGLCDCLRKLRRSHSMRAEDVTGTRDPVLFAALDCALVLRDMAGVVAVLEAIAEDVDNRDQVVKLFWWCQWSAARLQARTIDGRRPDSGADLAEALCITPTSTLHGLLEYRDIAVALSQAQDDQEPDEDYVSPPRVTRGDVLRAIRGIRANGPRPILAREILHSYGHSVGYGSPESMFAHRACVVLSLKYGPGADEFAFERHCLGHSYEAHGRYVEARNEYESALIMLQALWGDRHYLVPELRSHLAKLDDYVDGVGGGVS